MNVKVLSIRNPYSYLVCAGIKDVENRSWTTKYRGKIYIQSCGNEMYEIDSSFPEYELLKVHQELDKICKKEDIAKLFKFRYIEVNFEKKMYKLKDEKYRKEFELMVKAINSEDSFYKTECIIGSVELIEVKKEEKSEWAGKNCYHWILKNPVLFEEPIMHIKGRQRLYDYNLEE